MTMQNPQPKPDPKPEPMSEQDAEALLPWYANGRASHAEARAIEAALKTSSALRAQLEAVRRERAATIESTETAGEARPENLQRLLRQLDATRQFSPARTEEPGLLHRLWSGVGATRPVLQFTLAAACLAVVVEGVALYRMAGDGGAIYSTASGPPESGPLQTATGPRLIVIFQPAATIAAIQGALGDIGASVVEGPMPDGGYVIALPEGADSAVAIGKLQSRSDLVASAIKGN